MREAADGNGGHYRTTREWQKILSVPGSTPDYGRMRRKNKGHRRFSTKTFLIKYHI
jgi:hypothetical protein